GKNEPERVAQIVSGVAEGCVQAGCALVGGETAEMPGFYPPDEYDLAGFSVGMVDYDRMIDGSAVEPGDVLIGIRSSGVHSNGFSLVRKVFQIDEKTINTRYDELSCTLGEALLEPTKIYVKTMLSVIGQCNVHAISHITGGGFYENIPRMLQEGTRAVIEKARVPVLPIFDLIAQVGKIPERDMYNTFNMGIGMLFAVAAADTDKALAAVQAAGENAYIVGEIRQGKKGVELW